MTSDDLTARSLQALLRRFDACKEARASTRGLTGRDAWDQCVRGDWLLNRD